MSNHNYSQYSNKKNKAKGSAAEVKMEVEAAEVVTTPPVIETVETVALPKPVVGRVGNCSKLNIRVKPAATADVVCVVNADDKLTIDPSESSTEWLAVTTVNGVQGFCMKKFVNAKL